MSFINEIIIDRFVAEAFRRIGAVDLLLDLGCGEQPYRPHYVSCARHIIAADYEERSKISVRLSAKALPFRDSVFDVVLLTEVLEHVDEPEVVISEVARVLKPGGWLVMTVPFNYMQHEIPCDYIRYTQFGLCSLLSRNAMRIEYFYQRGSLLTLLVAELEFLFRMFGIGLERAPILRLIALPANVVCNRVWRVMVRLLWGALRARNSVDANVDQSALRNGRTLRGVRGHLRLWSLGYCLLARHEPT